MADTTAIVSRNNAYYVTYINIHCDISYHTDLRGKLHLYISIHHTTEWEIMKRTGKENRRPERDGKNRRGKARLRREDWVKGDLERRGEHGEEEQWIDGTGDCR